MVKDNIQILVTGEYWHSDFGGLTTSSAATITLCPLDKLRSLEGPQSFDLVVITQGRRGVVPDEDIDRIQSTFATTPIVALLGSWCEGEKRSGSPWPGIPRIYWHQWQGQFQQFLNCLQENNIHPWQMPATTTASDEVVAGPHFGEESFSGIVAVSAWTKTQFDMIEDALSAFNAKSCWVERSTWDGEAKELVKVVIVDDDSLTGDLETRIRWIISTFGQVPVVLTLGFPRKDEVESLQAMGVGAVVSKPFKLGDLKQAILQATQHRQHSPSANTKSES